MDRNTLVAEVSTRLNLEAADVQFSKSDILTAVLDGNTEMADAAEHIEEELSVPRTTNTYYPLVDLGTLTIKSIRNPNTNRFLEMKSVDDLDKKYTRDWELVTGEPEFYFMRGLFHVGVFPKSPTAADFLEFFQTTDIQILSPAQEPSMPLEHQYGIIEYAMYSLLRDYGELKKAMIHWDSYQVHERKFVAWVRSRMKSRWGIIG